MKKLYTFLAGVTFVAGSLSAQSWTSLNSPAGGNGGDINTSNDDIYIFQTSGGFIKSTDGGTNWTSVTANYPVDQIQGLWCLNSGNILLYGMSATYSFNLYKSTDGGTNWTLLSVTGGPTGGGGMYEAPNGTLYWLPSYNGVATVKMSTDEGATWTTTTNLFKHMAFTATAAYALRLDGSNNPFICKSTDDGATWVNQPCANLYYGTSGFAVSPTNGNIYTCNGTSNPVQVSTDDGSTFSDVGGGKTSYSVTVDYNNNLFAGSAADLAVSTDNGATWVAAIAGLANPGYGVSNIWPHPDGTTYGSSYVPGTSGIHKYSSGGGSVGIVDATNSKLKVYPNPSTDYVVIENNEEHVGTIEFVLYNSVGQIVLNETVGKGRFDVRVSQLSTGTYTYELRNGANASDRGTLVIK